MFKGRTSTETSQFSLNHCPQVTGSVMTKFDDAAGLAFENDYHATSDLGCWNCHCLFFLSDCVVALKDRKLLELTNPVV